MIDTFYQLCVILVMKWDKATAVMWYNFYFTVSVATWYFPAFMYDLFLIYWFEDEFEYIPA